VVHTIKPKLCQSLIFNPFTTKNTVCQAQKLHPICQAKFHFPHRSLRSLSVAFNTHISLTPLVALVMHI